MVPDVLLAVWSVVHPVSYRLWIVWPSIIDCAPGPMGMVGGSCHNSFFVLTMCTYLFVYLMLTMKPAVNFI